MIGVFDSGMGGLTVLKEFLKELPQYDYVYLGDNARTPYGNRSHETVMQFTEEAVNYLFSQGCVLIITACNTVSAQALRGIQEKYLRVPGIKEKKILGVIKPVVEKALEISSKKRIGVVGTRGTIASKSFEVELKAINPHIHVSSQACPLLVPLIEENWHHRPETRMILKKYLAPLKTHNIDTLILACTHYPFLLKEFRRIMGKKVHIPNPGDIIAASLKDYLQRHPEIESKLGKKGTCRYLTTDAPERFKEIGSRFMGFSIANVEQVDIAHPQKSSQS